MNFITHFRNWAGHAESDTRLKSHHISLYIALFNYWNESRFHNPFTIFRHEIMALSKIGSVNTYTKSLKELTEWNYIRYEPSFDPRVGSKVHLYRFDKGSSKGAHKGNSQADGKRTGKGIRKGRATYDINIPNPLNIKNNLNREGTRPTDSIPASFEEAQAYFLEIQSTAVEAQKFFNHFQSNGWKVGGRAAMKNWRAAARKWVMNAKNFTYEHNSQPKPGKLNTGPKNYSEPL